MDNILDSREQTDTVSDNTGRSKAIYYIMLGVIFLDVLHLTSQFLQYQLLTTNGGVFSEAEAQANNLRVQLVAILVLIIRLASIIVFIMWFRRAYNNLHKIGVPHLEFSEGWGAGAWFVPFINLARPYTIMK